MDMICINKVCPHQGVYCHKCFVENIHYHQGEELLSFNTFLEQVEQQMREIQIDLKQNELNNQKIQSQIQRNLLISISQQKEKMKEQIDQLFEQIEKNLKDEIGKVEQDSINQDQRQINLIQDCNKLLRKIQNVDGDLNSALLKQQTHFLLRCLKFESLKGQKKFQIFLKDDSFESASIQNKYQKVQVIFEEQLKKFNIQTNQIIKHLEEYQKNNFSFFTNQENLKRKQTLDEIDQSKQKITQDEKPIQKQIKQDSQVVKVSQNQDQNKQNQQTQLNIQNKIQSSLEQKKSEKLEQKQGALVKQNDVKIFNFQKFDYDSQFKGMLKLRRLNLTQEQIDKNIVDTYEFSKVSCISFQSQEKLKIHGLSLFRRVKGEIDPKATLYIQKGILVENDLKEMNSTFQEQEIIIRTYKENEHPIFSIKLSKILQVEPRETYTFKLTMLCKNRFQTFRGVGGEEDQSLFTFIKTKVNSQIKHYNSIEQGIFCDIYYTID